MRHNLTFTVVVVLTLAVGIGANTAVFSVLNSVLLKPLSYPRSDELIALRHVAPGAGGIECFGCAESLPVTFLTYTEQNRTDSIAGSVDHDDFVRRGDRARTGSCRDGQRRRPSGT